MAVGRWVRVYGRVQGVFFRNWTRDKARSLRLRGWVRNRLDGSVELIAYGEEKAVDALIAACGIGPPAAHVDRIEVKVIDGECPPAGFEVTAPE
jgi:acylphosphatase